MNKKFEKVSLEKSTQIIFQTEAELGEYEVLYQKWYWDGVNAESIIFSSEDISTTQIYTHLDYNHLSKVYNNAHPRAKRMDEL